MERLYFDLQRDFGFGNYATFNGKWDWRFKRKHHLIFLTTPVVSSRTTTINRTIDWQGQTFNAGARVDANIRSLIFTPGYQWDFIRRQSISLGLLVDVNLAYTDAKLKATGAISGGGSSASRSAQAEGSLFAPLPVVGPTFRWYAIPHSSRFYLDGALTGMSFFGYGNFVSANAALGFRVAHNWNVRVGYLLGSRYKIYGVEPNRNSPDAEGPSFRSGISLGLALTRESCQDTGRSSLWRHADCLRGSGWDGRSASSCRRLAP
jgi:hypothetical protein